MFFLRPHFYTPFFYKYFSFSLTQSLLSSLFCYHHHHPCSSQNHLKFFISTVTAGTHFLCFFSFFLRKWKKWKAHSIDVKRKSNQTSKRKTNIIGITSLCLYSIFRSNRFIIIIINEREETREERKENEEKIVASHRIIFTRTFMSWWSKIYIFIPFSSVARDESRPRPKYTHTTRQDDIHIHCRLSLALSLYLAMRDFVSYNHRPIDTIDDTTSVCVVLVFLRFFLKHFFVMNFLDLSLSFSVSLNDDDDDDYSYTWWCWWYATTIFISGSIIIRAINMMCHQSSQSSSFS